jgi:acetyl esterase/lipase
MEDYAALGRVHPDFAPLVDGLNEAFARIWTPDNVAQLRKNFESSRSQIPGIPVNGFEISHRMIPVSDGSEVEIRIYRPSAISGDTAKADRRLPLFFIAHGGGTTSILPKGGG